MVNALPVPIKALTPVAGAAIVLLAPIDIDTHARRALAIAVAMILAWIVECLDPAIVGFIGAFLFRAAADVEFETAFAGFATTTPWFLYGALILLNAADKSGVIARLGGLSPTTMTRSALSAAIAILALAYALSFVLPSTLARAAILALVAMAWSLDRGGRRTLLVLTACYAAVAFGHPGMPGGALAIGGWDVAVAAALVAGVLTLSRRIVGDDDSSARPAVQASLDPKVAVVIAITVALWLTASVHRVSPDLIGLAAGLVCSLPIVVKAPDGHARATADPLAIILAGTAISIPTVLLETHASDALIHLWSTLAKSAGVLPHDVLEFWATTAYRLFSPDGARPGLPILDGIASPAGSAASWAYAGSTMLSLHQSPALALAVSLAGVRAWQVLTVGMLVLMAGSVVVIVF